MNLKILATIKMLDTSEGGLDNTIQNKPRCTMYLDGSYHDCQLYLTSPLHPGEVRDKVPIAFFCPELVVEKLQTCSEFKLWAGKFFALGIVGEIHELNEDEFETLNNSI